VGGCVDLSRESQNRVAAYVVKDWILLPSIFFTLIVLGGGTTLAKILSVKPLTWLGRVSYCFDSSESSRSLLSPHAVMLSSGFSLLRATAPYSARSRSRSSCCVPPRALRGLRRLCQSASVTGFAQGVGLTPELKQF
jgi:hypothetical protein